jgi:hypothetical protein
MFCCQYVDPRTISARSASEVLHSVDRVPGDGILQRRVLVAYLGFYKRSYKSVTTGTGPVFASTSEDIETYIRPK